MEDSKINELLLDELSSLGVSALSQFMDASLVERLARNGIEITSLLLAKLIVSEKGLGVLRAEDLRLLLVQKLGLVKVNAELGTNFSCTEDVLAFNKFKWGSNNETRRFLRLLGIQGELSADQSKLEEIETIHISSPLHPYQNYIRKSLYKFLSISKKRKVIVHMPTGSGKTRTSLEAICDYLRSLESANVIVVWLAHSEELCEQAAESIFHTWKRLGFENGEIVRLWGGAKPKLTELNGPTFVVSSFQTAYKMIGAKNDERFSLFTFIRRKCSVLLVDEAHQSIAPTYKQAIDLFSTRKSKIVGLTATPGRHHVNSNPEETIQLAEYFEGNKIDIVDNQGLPLEDPITFLTSEGILSKVRKYQIKSPRNVVLTESEIQHIQSQLDIPKSVLLRLGEDSARTNLIAANILKIVSDMDRQTIVFAPSKECAVELAVICTLRGCLSEAITGETDKRLRKDAIKAFKSGSLKVLVNFGVLTTGFDAPNIGAVVIARPTTSVVLYSQMIGRGLRGPKMGGGSDCIIVDVIDNIENMPSSSQAFTYFNGYFNRAEG